MNIKDDLLIESYYKAIELNLEESFIQILKNEIERRKIDLNSKRYLSMKK